MRRFTPRGAYRRRRGRAVIRAGGGVSLRGTGRGGRGRRGSKGSFDRVRGNEGGRVDSQGCLPL